MKTYDELLEGLKELKKRGFVKTHRAGDTGIGKTLEDMLGIDENNIAGPDGEDTELKAARKNSPSMLTLFTKAPLPRGINSKLRKEYGYPDKKRQSKRVLRTTIDAIDFNTIKGKKGFKIISKDNRIEILPAKKSPNMENPYWLKKHFADSVRKKYKKSLLYVKANVEDVGTSEKFHFNEAYLLHGFDFEKFSDNLKKGILKIDIRLGLYADGRYHDHGTGVRIKPAMLEECFIGKRVI